MKLTIPAARPARPYFSCGPACKRPGYSLENLRNGPFGRSHRSSLGKSKLKLAVDLTREVLQIPAGYRIGLMPGSDTGAIEAALWSMLGPRGVEVIAWEAFSELWVIDIVEQLRLENARATVARYGEIVDLSSLDFDNDVVFTWNGTTSGVCVQNADFIPADRKGLTFCDATSAAFGMRLDWDKLDVVTFSWQKMLGGEAAHGMLVLSPRAVERLESYTPSWPIPKLFRLTEKGRLIEAIFDGEIINTPSMLCVEDYLDTLGWAKSIGGLDALIARVEANSKVMSDWVVRTPWIAFLAGDPAIRSTSAHCLRIVDPDIVAGGVAAETAFVGEMVRFLEIEEVAFDVGAYKDAPPGLRIWGGATIDAADLEALTQWLDYAYARAKAERFAEAA